MNTKADLPLLSEKLLAAKGGDREIDALIHLVVTSFEPRRAGPGWPNENDLVIPTFPGWALLPHYTADLSAAVALVEAKLPGLCWIVRSPAMGELKGAPYFANIYGHPSTTPGFPAYAPTPALALLCAFIAAMGEKT